MHRFGAGYLAKVPIKRALEQAGLAEMTAAEKFWYVVENIAFGSGYFAKVIAVKALSETRCRRRMLFKTEYRGPGWAAQAAHTLRR